MKELFVVGLIALATSGCATTGTGTSNRYGFNWFPTIDVVVINDCANSTIFVKPSRGVETAIKFGNSETIILSRYPGQDDQLLLSVRGVGDEGSYLGSDSRTFYAGQRGRREEAWHIVYLRGGTRPCQ